MCFNTNKQIKTILNYMNVSNKHILFIPIGYFLPNTDSFLKKSHCEVKSKILHYLFYIFFYW